MPLYNKVQGDAKKPTLVFLHGFLGTLNDWDETIAFLKDDFYCISLDLPGHGNSTSVPLPLQNGFEATHLLIKNTLEVRGITDFTLVGYSLGARIALDYARTQNDKGLKKLILESCHTGLHNQVDKDNRYQLDREWAELFATQSMEATLDEWYDQDIFSSLSEHDKEEFIEKRRHNYGVYLANSLVALSLSKQPNSIPFLKQLVDAKTLPIHYCYGNQDTKFKKLAEKLEAQSGVEITGFNNAGHNIHEQEPKVYAHYIKQKLKK